MIKHVITQKVHIIALVVKVSFYSQINKVVGKPIHYTTIVMTVEMHLKLEIWKMMLTLKI